MLLHSFITENGWLDIYIYIYIGCSKIYYGVSNDLRLLQSCKGIMKYEEDHKDLLLIYCETRTGLQST